MSHINLQKIVSVKGQPGLFHLRNYNSKGYFLQPFGEGAIRFFSNEKDKILAVGNVDLKLADGVINTRDIFIKMKEQPGLSLNSDRPEIEDYFKNLLPDLQEEVAPGHLEKINKWYYLITEHHHLNDMVNEGDEGLTIV